MEGTGNVVTFPSGTLNRVQKHSAQLLYYACKSKLGDELASLLADASESALKADTNGELTAQLLNMACTNGYLGAAAKLLTSGAKATTMHDSSTTLLAMACRVGNANLVRLLLRYDADVTTPDRNGDTPMIVSVKNGHMACAQVLLDHGARIDSTHESTFHPGDRVRVKESNEESEAWKFQKVVSCSRRSGDIINDGLSIKGRGDWYWCTGPAIPETVTSTCFYEIEVEAVESTSDLYFGFGRAGMTDIGDDSDVPGIYYFKTYLSTPKLYPSGVAVGDHHKTRPGDVIRVELDPIDHTVTFLKNGEIVGKEPITVEKDREQLAPYLSVYHSSSTVTLRKAGTLQGQYSGKNGQVESVDAHNKSWKVKVTVESVERPLVFPDSALTSTRQHPASLLYLACHAKEDKLGKALLEAGRGTLSIANPDGAQIFKIASANALAQTVETLLLRCKGQQGLAETILTEAVTKELKAAVANGHEKLVVVLLTYGGDPNALDDNEEPMLHVAIRGGYSTIAKALIEKDAATFVGHTCGFKPGDSVTVSRSSGAYKKAFEKIIGRYTNMNAMHCGKSGQVVSILKCKSGWAVNVKIDGDKARTTSTNGDPAARNGPAQIVSTDFKSCPANQYGSFFNVTAKDTPIMVTGILASADDGGNTVGDLWICKVGGYEGRTEKADEWQKISSTVALNNHQSTATNLPTYVIGATLHMHD